MRGPGSAHGPRRDRVVFAAAPRYWRWPLLPALTVGNFSLNHLTVVRGRATASTCATCSTRPRSRRSRSAGFAGARSQRKRAEVARGVTLTVGGRPVALTCARAGARLPARRRGCTRRASSCC